MWLCLCLCLCLYDCLWLSISLAIKAFRSVSLFRSLSLSHLAVPLPMFDWVVLHRPQRGRYRQFVQFGVECIGSGHPHADVEAIVLGADILQMLGVLPATELRINTLCDEVTRATHRAALTDFLHAHDANLSAVSKRRLESGAVLRILDTKDKSDQALLKGAPTLLDHANPESIEKFEAVLEGLTQSGVEYTVDHSMVRGLDYYTGTVFEFVTTELGAQGAVLAGGRYDG